MKDIEKLNGVKLLAIRDHAKSNNLLGKFNTTIYTAEAAKYVVSDKGNDSIGKCIMELLLYFTANYFVDGKFKFSWLSFSKNATMIKMLWETIQKVFDFSTK